MAKTDQELINGLNELMLTEKQKALDKMSGENANKQSPTIDKAKAEKEAEKEKQYDPITQKNTENAANKEKQSKMDSANLQLAKKYSIMLANWYGINSFFFAGTIRMVGNPDIRVGQVLQVKDPAGADFDVANPEQNPSIVEYYIEGVSHEFDWKNGFTTVARVTRGLPIGITRDATVEGGGGETIDRFRYWNDPVTNSESTTALTMEHPGNGDLQLFTGGLFGEASFAFVAQKANESEEGDSGSGDTGVIPEGAKGKDTYPTEWKSAAQDTIFDSWNYLNRECVSYVAWKLHEDKRNNIPFSRLGNAVSWRSQSQASTHSTPQAGDVAWFNAGAWGGNIRALGHVGYVEKVTGDKIIMSDYNFGDPGGMYHLHQLDKNVPTSYLRFRK